ncbi:T9SS type A sorting domain-containing protein [Fulvivirga sp. M361]|uniref:T9SS type A sorting domain-containing protein n=1 Tax=Fulvivirga sp. M361 TaxID=2594266 RepID=UPI001179B1C5|nr:T9SS type A sorting domain-containing protein [Fulvivirga sp. M361]TRX56160.1 T9SS type A sorting domain-containing protein [Fulvivirga sp. M361]
MKQHISTLLQVIRISFLLYFSFSAPIILSAQVTDYTFSHRKFEQASSPVQASLLKDYDIYDRTKQGAIVINNDLEEDTSFVSGPGFPIGFDFFYDGQYYDRFAASANGYIKLGKSEKDFMIKRDTLLGAIFQEGFDKERQNIISAFQTDVNTTIPFGHTLEYSKARGFPGEKQTIIDWYFIYYSYRYPEYTRSPYFTAQITLMEEDGSIEMFYEKDNRGFPAHIQQVAVGLRGSRLNNHADNLHLRGVVKGINDWKSSKKQTDPTTTMDFDEELIEVAEIFTFTPPIDSSSLPECPEAYYLVSNHHPNGKYGDDDHNYILLDGADSVARNPTLGWSHASLLDNTYDVYFSTDNPPTERIAADLEERRLKLPELAAGTTYYVGIISHNKNGKTPLCISSFTTAGELGYCENKHGPAAGYGKIKAVKFNTLDFRSNPDVNELTLLPNVPPYTTTLTRGKTYTFRYEQAAIPELRLSTFVFIDFDGNGKFSETNNSSDYEAFSLGLIGPSAGFLEKQITIPNDAKLGNTRLRIKNHSTRWISANPWNPCAYTALFGQDYIITIAPSEECADFSMTTATDPLSCFESADGSIALQLTGGTAPYSIRWKKDGENYPGNATIQNNLDRGTYQAFVIDDKGCDIQTSLMAITQPTALRSTNVFEINPDCHNVAQGSISLNMEGGTPPYSYLWSNGKTTSSIDKLSEAQYSVNVTDQNNCLFTSETFTISAPKPMTIDHENVQGISCNGESDGKITLNVTGGTPPYSYLWSDGQTTSTIDNLPEGQYSVTITDEKDCQLTSMPYALSMPEALTAEVLGNNAREGEKLSIQVKGGKQPYRYQWSNGHDQATLGNAPAGQYTVTVTDSNECLLQIDNITIKPKLITSVEDDNAIPFSIYPNPSRKFVTVELPQKRKGLYKNWKLSLVDMQGKVLKKGTFSDSADLTFDLSDIDAGQYYLKVSDGENSSMKKLVVQ